MKDTILIYPLDKCTDDQFVGVEVSWLNRKERTLLPGEPVTSFAKISMQNCKQLRDSLNTILGEGA